MRRVSFSAWAKGSSEVDVDGSAPDEVGGVQRRQVLDCAVQCRKAAELVDEVPDVDDDVVGIVDWSAGRKPQSLLTKGLSVCWTVQVKKLWSRSGAC